MQGEASLPLINIFKKENNDNTKHEFFSEKKNEEYNIQEKSIFKNKCYKKHKKESTKHGSLRNWMFQKQMLGIFYQCIIKLGGGRDKLYYRKSG